MDGIAQLGQWVGESQSLVFFGGAGVSTESGIPDFRSAESLARQDPDLPLETLLSIQYFRRQPKDFYRYYRQAFLAPNAGPNPAHKGLAALERDGRLAAVITQNVDGLHQQAGSRVVYELHGSVHRNHCMACGGVYGAAAVRDAGGVPRCGCGHRIRPGIVLYGEGLPQDAWRGAVCAMEGADLLLVGGTSLRVYPAAGLLDRFRGTRLVLINQEPTPWDDRADLILRQPIGQVFSRLMDCIGRD